MKLVVFGLSITSSWGNGHATTYRALLQAVHRRGHRVVFFEKDEEWYASNRDLPAPDFCEMRVFQNWQSAVSTVRRELADADAAIVGSFFPEGIPAARELLQSRVPVKAFYDIDTPITLSKLRQGGAEYLSCEDARRFDLYLSFTAGPILQRLEREFGVQSAVPLYCSFDPHSHFPRSPSTRYSCDFSYMGTYAADRQAKLDDLLLDTARALPERRFIIAGPQYPSRMKWPRNVRHIRHLSPRWHPSFYSSSRFTLNLTRLHMAKWGYSPSVRLFEAAACGSPIISDTWPGLESFFEIGKEILVAESHDHVISILKEMSEEESIAIGRAARERVLLEHTAEHRASQLETYISSVPRRGHIDHQSLHSEPKAGLVPTQPLVI